MEEFTVLHAMKMMLEHWPQFSVIIGIYTTVIVTAITTVSFVLCRLRVHSIRLAALESAAPKEQPPTIIRPR